MTLLAVDIRSRLTALAVVDGGEVRRTWQVSSDERRTSDEWGALLGALLAGSRDEVTGVVVGSTSPAISQVWRRLIVDLFADIPHVYVEAGTRTGLSVRTDNPREIGADRVCNAVALSAHAGGPAIAVDFGVATTYDVIDEKGVYVGGVITPGIEVSLEALERHAPQLRRVELFRPRAVIAKNTVEALQSGAVFGFAGQVDGLVSRILRELEADPGQARVVATGPLAPLVVEECEFVTHHDPILTFRGLALVFDRNR